MAGAAVPGDLDRRLADQGAAQVPAEEVGGLQHVVPVQSVEDLQMLGALDDQPLPVEVRPVLQQPAHAVHADERRSEEHTSELQSLMRTSNAVFCLKKKTKEPTRKKTRNMSKQ